MPGLARRMIVLSTAVFAATAVLPGRADARTLFEALFGGPIQRVEPVEPAPPQAPRVATPVYYTYKADPLVRVDFRKLVAQAEARQQAAADAATHSITVASAELQESPDVARLDDASTGEGTTAGPTVPAEGIDAATPSGAEINCLRAITSAARSARTRRWAKSSASAYSPCSLLTRGIIIWIPASVRSATAV